MLISTIALAILTIFDLGPGLIHVFAPDGGVSSIADFTNYQAAQKELLWAIGIIGTD
jgi:hypothetical protein